MNGDITALLTNDVLRVITGVGEIVQNNVLEIEETNLVDGTVTAVSKVMNGHITTLSTNDV